MDTPQPLGRERLIQHWILDADGEPQRVDDLLVWASWYETRPALLQTWVGRVWVSTVFTGLSVPSLRGYGPWETMIFGGLFDLDRNRDQSKAEALGSHRRAVAAVHAYRGAPRKTRKALKKARSSYRARGEGAPRVGHREAARVERVVQWITTTLIREDRAQ